MASKKYAFVPMDDDEEAAPQKVKKQRRHDENKSSRHSRSHRSRRRSRSPKRESKHYSSRTKTSSRRDRDRDYDARWGDHDEPPAEEEDFREAAAKRVKRDHDDDAAQAEGGAGRPEATQEELEEERDREERDAFAKRLKERVDKSSNKNVVEDHLSAQRQRLADDSKARDAALPDMRIRSRQEYLKKREAERLALLRKQVAEETAELKSGVRLSEKEKAEFAKNREILRLAEERLRIDDHRDGYYMPEDYITEKGKIDKKKKEDALYKRYVDKDEYGQEKFVTEHEEWEREQAAKAKAQIQRGEREDEGDYDYILEEETYIQWADLTQIGPEGKLISKDEAFLQAQIDAAEKKQLSIQETRKNLPIYAYRDEFLAAMAEYQVIVIVGETGSGKTTQLPQYLHEAGYTKGGKIVGCPQPRRVAAMRVAARVTDEISIKISNEVGYSIRFEDNTSDKTILKYMTNGTPPLLPCSFR